MTANPAPPTFADKVLAMVGPAAPAQLTGKEQFELYLLSVGGPVPLIGEAGGAAVGQWWNAPAEWGQGWAAFGKRYGSNLAYNGIRQTITYGGWLLLREDTRYFASTRRGFLPRTRHALISTFTARKPDGRDVFSVSATAGVIGASAISSIWGPSSWKGPKNIAANAGISFASTAAFNVLREYLSDILHRPQH